MRLAASGCLAPASPRQGCLPQAAKQSCTSGSCPGSCLCLPVAGGRREAGSPTGPGETTATARATAAGHPGRAALAALAAVAAAGTRCAPLPHCQLEGACAVLTGCPAAGRRARGLQPAVQQRRRLWPRRRRTPLIGQGRQLGVGGGAARPAALATVQCSHAQTWGAQTRPATATLSNHLRGKDKEPAGGKRARLCIACTQGNAAAGQAADQPAAADSVLVLRLRGPPAGQGQGVMGPGAPRRRERARLRLARAAPGERGRARAACARVAGCWQRLNGGAPGRR